MATSKTVWSSALAAVTYAKFQLVIKGISYGEFDLRIAHSTDTNSRTYQQNNAMTRLSWGPARDYIARPDLNRNVEADLPYLQPITG